MAELPFLSIVLCTYNGLPFLPQLLDSLLVQEGVAEIVVADDCSTDGTFALIEAYARRDPRIRFHQNARRIGVTRNFECVISLATSPWIALADQDDVWLPDKIARIRRAWDGHSDLIHHASWKFRGEVPLAVPSRAADSRKFLGNDPRRLLYRNSITGHATVMRRALADRLLPFPPGVMYDWWLGLGAAALGHVQYLDEYLVLYRIHERNAFHARGSRWRRARAALALRLQVLSAFSDLTAAAASARDFARTYRCFLEQAREVSFSANLFRFYLRHSDLLFGRAAPRLSRFVRWRKSFSAALEAAVFARGSLSPKRPAAQILRSPLPADVLTAASRATLFARTFPRSEALIGGRQASRPADVRTDTAKPSQRLAG